MKKKYMKIATIFALLALVLVGCGKTDDNKQADGDVITLQVYQIGDAPKNIDALTDAINEISEKEIGVRVKFNYIGWGDYEEKMSVMVTSGDEFDIAFANNYVINAQKGAYADLTDLVKEYAQGFFDSIDPIYYEGNLVNGKLYAFPVNGNVFAQQMLSFNGDLVEKYNLDISNINSYIEAKDVLQVIKDNEPETAPFAIGSGFKANLGNFDYVLGDALPFAIDVSDGSNKLVNPYLTNSGKQRLTELHELYKAGLIPVDAATSSTSFDLNTDTWFMRQETQGPTDYGDALLTQVAGKPIISRPLNIAIKSTAQAQMANFIVSVNSPNKEAAVKWLNLLNTTPQMMNTLVYGIENEAWKPVSDIHLELLEGYQDGMHMAAWNTGNNAILLKTENITDEMIKASEEAIKNAVTSPILGFTFNTDNVSAEISAIRNVMDEYGSSLNTGTVDPATTLPEFEQKLENAGYSKVLEEMQKQFDEFLAQ